MGQYEIRELAARGMSKSELARMFGVSHQRISQILNPKAHKARQKVNEKLTAPLYCEACDGETKLHAHHPDYDKPLTVVWLCISCHAKLHSSLRSQENVAKIYAAYEAQQPNQSIEEEK